MHQKDKYGLTRVRCRVILPRQRLSLFQHQYRVSEAYLPTRSVYDSRTGIPANCLGRRHCSFHHAPLLSHYADEGKEDGLHFIDESASSMAPHQRNCSQANKLTPIVIATVETASGVMPLVMTGWAFYVIGELRIGRLPESPRGSGMRSDVHSVQKIFAPLLGRRPAYMYCNPVSSGMECPAARSFSWRSDNRRTASSSSPCPSRSIGMTLFLNLLPSRRK
jgi:hypothetical protein